jgi:hypothetical protein
MASTNISSARDRAAETGLARTRNGSDMHDGTQDTQWIAHDGPRNRVAQAVQSLPRDVSHRHIRQIYPDDARGRNLAL